jgi:hypothetical protein
MIPWWARERGFSFILRLPRRWLYQSAWIRILIEIADPNAILQIDGLHGQQAIRYAFQLVTKLIRGNDGVFVVGVEASSRDPVWCFVTGLPFTLV